MAPFGLSPLIATVLSMKIIDVVSKVLDDLATAHGLQSWTVPSDVIVDSLDQMRLLVALEERLNIEFDDAELEPFPLGSTEALVAYVRNLVESTPNAT